MNTVELFLQATPEMPETEQYAPSTRWKDSDGNPILWTLKAVPVEAIQKMAKDADAIAEKEGVTPYVVYQEMMAVASTVEPDLQNAELQNKMGVHTPRALLKALLPFAGEYARYIQKAQKINGLAEGAYDKAVVETKNA